MYKSQIDELSRDERLTRMYERMKQIINAIEASEEVREKALDTYFTIARSAFEEGEEFALSRLNELTKLNVEKVVKNTWWVKAFLFVISAGVSAMTAVFIYSILGN